MILGGRGYDTAQVELYNPETEKFELSPTLLFSKKNKEYRSLTATPLANGQILILGNNIGKLFDPTSEAFSNSKIKLKNLYFFDQKAIPLNKNEFLVWGTKYVPYGIKRRSKEDQIWYELQSEIINITTGQSRSINVNNTKSVCHSFYLLPSGKIFTAGQPLPFNKNEKSWAEILVPETNSRIPVEIPFSACEVLGILKNGELLVHKSDQSAYRYDSKSNTLLKIKGATSPMYPIGTTVINLSDGKAIIIGGTSKQASPNNLNIEIYNPKTNTFTTGPSIAPFRIEFHATLLKNNQLLITGGWVQHQTWLGEYRMKDFNNADLLDLNQILTKY